MKFKLVLVFMVGIISGCSTVPNSAMRFDEVKIKEPSESTGVLVLFRKLTPPLANDMYVFINDKKLAALPNEAFTWVELEAGNVKVKIDWSDWALMPSQEFEINIEPNTRKYLELSSSVDIAFSGVATYGGGNNSVNNLQAIQAESELSECCRFVPSKERW